jgi:hypothetical protein
MYQSVFLFVEAELPAERSWKSKIYSGTRTRILQDRRGSLPDRRGGQPALTSSAWIPAAEKMLVQGSFVTGKSRFMLRMNVKVCFGIDPTLPSVELPQ